jgi:hypothetical protein
MKLPKYPAAGRAEIGSWLAFKAHRLGLPEPGRSAKPQLWLPSS